MIKKENVWKDCRVVKISTEISKLHIEDDGTTHIDPVLSSYGGLNHFHLYILSDVEINVNDWYLTCDNRLVKWLNEFESFKRDINFTAPQPIIASTDTTLEVASIPEEFLEEYCDKCGIDQVSVEYKSNWYVHRGIGKYHADEPRWMKSYLNMEDLIPVGYPKTINIKPSEKNYTHTQTELKALLHKCWIQATRKTLEPLSEMGFGGWLKENL